MQVPQYLLPIAQLLHEGTNVCLRKLLLANLYDSLSKAVTILRSPFPITQISGPFSLLQLWLNGIFEDKSNITLPGKHPHGNVGPRLSVLTLLVDKAHYFEDFMICFIILILRTSSSPLSHHEHLGQNGLRAH